MSVRAELGPPRAQVFGHLGAVLAGIAVACVALTCAPALGASAEEDGQVFTSYGDWAAAAGAHTTIDFEDQPDGTIITDQYQGLTPLGVLFQAVDGDAEIEDAIGITQEVGGTAVSGSKVLDAESPDTAAIEATFVETGTTTPTSVPAAGGWLLDISSFGGGMADFYDINDTQIGHVEFAPDAEQNIFLGAVNPAGISRVSFDGIESSEFVMIDDVAFVPDPATLTLLGLGGCALLRRRRR